MVIRRSSQTTALTLPSERTKPVKDIEKYVIYLYGKDGIGKTSFTSQFPDALHFLYEPSGDALSLYTVEPRDWGELLDYIALLEKQKEEGTLKFKTVVIDIIDLCFKHCLKYVCEPLNVDYPPQDYGKTWSMIGDEFRDAMYRIKRVAGLVCVSHATERDIERLDGLKYSTIVPTLGNTAHQVLSKFCGLKVFYGMNTRGVRTLTLRPNNTCDVKCRLSDSFLYSNGEPIQAINMGKSETEAWTNFMRAYNNKLKKPEPVVDGKKTASDTSTTTKKPLTLRRRTNA